MQEPTTAFVGATGGAGTTTVAAVYAVTLARRTAEPVDLVTYDRDDVRAMFAMGPDDVRLVTGAATVTIHDFDEPGTMTAPRVVVDAGALRPDSAAVQLVTGLEVDRTVAVLRGPSFNGVRRLGFNWPTTVSYAGIVLAAEDDRSLTARDVEDVTGRPVLAQWPMTATVARMIDAGLLLDSITLNSREGTKRASRLYDAVAAAYDWQPVR